MSKPVKGRRYQVYELTGTVEGNVSVGDVLVDHKYMGLKYEYKIHNMETGDWLGSIHAVYIGDREMAGKFSGPLVEAREESA